MRFIYAILLIVSIGCAPKSFEPKYAIGDCFNIAPPDILKSMGMETQSFYQITSVDKEASYLTYQVTSFSNLEMEKTTKAFSEESLNLFQKISCPKEINLKYEVGDCFDAVLSTISEEDSSIARQRELIFQIVNKKPKKYHPYEFITYSNKEKAVVKQAGVNTFNDTLFDKFKKIDCPKELTRSN